MKQSLQLKIPTPCGEDWTGMQPTEKGRHCQSCCKTVVDFTEMSDAEIIRHLSQAGPHVCGRLMPDQLNRTLAPAPVQKNGRSGWAWVLASLLMVAEGSDKGRPMKTGKIEVREPRADTDSTFPRIGMSIPRIDVKKTLKGTEQALMGDMVKIEPDSIQPPADTLSTVLAGMTRSEEFTGFNGGIVVGAKVDSAIDILTDTVKQIVADTLAALGWRPAPDLNIYPNPVSRGGALQLAWKTQPGQYQLTLMDMRGQLIAERILDVGGPGQVDSWEIPASLAAGIYVLRVVRVGMAGSGASGSGSAGTMGSGTAGPAAVCTREVMVR